MKKYIVEVHDDREFPYNKTVWRNEDGQFHRLDGPAIIWEDESTEWLVNDLRHRTDGPAIEFKHVKEWWVDGSRHRTDGPAVLFTNGHKEWWINGKRHRTDGPAVEYVSGTKEWWVDGELHRVNGPAIEFVDGTKEWWINYKQYTEHEFNEYIDLHTNKLTDN